MSVTLPHILMTASDPSLDLAFQKLMEPYHIRLTFCAFDTGVLIEHLQRREYDAVVVRCSGSDLPCAALLSRYHLYCSTSAAAFSCKPSIPFLAVLPGADPIRRQALLNSGYDAVLQLPLSEYLLASEVMELIRQRQETLAIHEKTLYTYFSELLLSLGCPAHLHGFRYLCCCLVYLTKTPDALHQLTQVLYPEIAATFNTSASNLERSMRTALDYMEQYGNQQLLSELLPSSAFHSRSRRRSFCVSELLAAIINKNVSLRRSG